MRPSKACFRKIEWNAYLIVCSFMSKRSSVERLRLTDGHFNMSNTCIYWMVISLIRVAGEGFEPTTSGLWARRASRLLYPAISIKNSLYSREINGRRRIRTFESIANRFTVCPLWPLGNPPICKKISALLRFSFLIDRARRRADWLHGLLCNPRNSRWSDSNW